MNNIEARKVAENLMSGAEMRGHSARFVEAKVLPRFPNEWTVLFDIISPEGTLIDGPVVVIVDILSGQARVMEGP